MFNLKEAERKYLCNSDFTGFWVTSHSAPSEKVRVVCGANPRQGLNCNIISSKKGSVSGSSTMEPQDADYDVPQLIDDVEDLILARVPRSEYGKFSVVNKRFLSLLKSGELFKIRKVLGFKEPSVFVLTSKETSWWSFDREFKSARMLPILPSSDPCFLQGDKESLCAGTHLLVLGNEVFGPVVWRYDLASNQWSKAPSMINSRCMFASATCSNLGYVAGGIGIDTCRGIRILNSAEKYNPESGLWESLPDMHRKRKSCSGCFMDNKFFVIGGINNEGNLACGEAFDLEKKTWELIPNMLENVPVLEAQSPPLVAVANNELYYLEASTNKLLAYLKKDKSWKNLGGVPVRADSTRGWGVAFKSLGNELLVIGASMKKKRQSMTVYTCCPDPEATELQWKRLKCGPNGLSNFIKNCSVMIA
ncbi:hypothetical protein FNV43_RR22314 [Rhamnella rubrinervis]|uniref:F-box/kelch-repeat protein n=1 Tax=Rhamnella rubrinervis TaxID=2594499 RepID=A0A8K0DPZ6_9ROSA|nr:hypothetical protein FNV43_RR22314 [Rhamnella rubrinervis]